MRALLKYLTGRPALLWIVFGAPVFFAVTQMLPASTMGTAIIWGAWGLVLVGCIVGARVAKLDNADLVAFNQHYIAKRFPRLNAVVDWGMDFAIIGFGIYYLLSAAERGVIGELGRGGHIEVMFRDHPIEFLFTFGLLLLFILLGIWRFVRLFRRRSEEKQ
ncbi:hypothetical protein [Methylocella sp. CPCC 101449]|uniref:hypothetical protein n=1 Tax=Methylocella sp. CPCC 101449 TaxID=2987531 RepID=UPI002891B227|nr:hypothetical protein [Methylocella sp. CPCC 101449]MDT2021070.1 hypothetical protein [Methylocella sp. CPCC 101449]